MQIKSFNYTKANGTTSKRVVMVTRSPSNMFMGVDLSELDEQAAREYAETYSVLMDSFMEQVAELDKAYDTQNRIRQFDPLKMTDCSEVWVGGDGE